MHEEKTEGIVLRSQDFKERHRIITLYSPEGLVSLIVRNISRKNSRLLSLTTPFTHGEYHYRRGQSELLSFRDGTLLDDHLILRQSLTTLKTAGILAGAVLSSQMPGKPSPNLFALYKTYHKQVPTFTDPAPLIASFYLKLLKHEGYLTLSPHCALCKSAANLLFNGESLCSKHSTHDALRFSAAEWDLLLTLDNAQQFSLLRTLTLPSSFFQKINTLFSSNGSS